MSGIENRIGSEIMERKGAESTKRLLKGKRSRRNCKETKTYKTERNVGERKRRRRKGKENIQMEYI